MLLADSGEVSGSIGWVHTVEHEQTAIAALSSGNPETSPLISKGVSFGAITVMPNGKVDPTDIEGVDWDLIIKPFHQKGAVVSLRQFTNNAMNHHHGMQSVERFGENTDPDSDQVVNELSVPLPI